LTGYDLRFMNTWHKSLPEHWRKRVTDLALKNSNGQFQDLSATTFRRSVGLNFPDGSAATFEHAFYLVDDERQELLLLSEHCGYHVFPLDGLQYTYSERTTPSTER
jgi:hypothetical protein